ncbi:MAG: hypothetical protein QOE36_727 [Gaiellaceae bacterium]|nr:hypothetical protein [Gaiellaceae bacterium]
MRVHLTPLEGIVPVMVALQPVQRQSILLPRISFATEKKQWCDAIPGTRVLSLSRRRSRRAAFSPLPQRKQKFSARVVRSLGKWESWR